MKCAIPLSDGAVAMHFGHCQQFALIDVDEDKKEVLNIAPVTPPPHEPGLLPRWLAGQGVTLVIAGGMGVRAQELLRENGIDVVLGVQASDPEQAVTEYLNGTLASGGNLCDH